MYYVWFFLFCLSCLLVVSCTVKRDVDVSSRGVGVFHYVDTISVNRNTTVKFPKE